MQQSNEELHTQLAPQHSAGQQGSVPGVPVLVQAFPPVFAQRAGEVARLAGEESGDQGSFRAKALWAECRTSDCGQKKTYGHSTAAENEQRETTATRPPMSMQIAKG